MIVEGSYTSVWVYRVLVRVIQAFREDGRRPVDLLTSGEWSLGLLVTGASGWCVPAPSGSLWTFERIGRKISRTTSFQEGLPAELKHISKRRKRKQ